MEKITQKVIITSQNPYSDEQKTKRLRTLLYAYAEGNKRKFAKMLGISETAFNQWFSRGSIVYERVLQKLPNVSAEWLIRGTGKVFLADDPNATLPADTYETNPPAIVTAHDATIAFNNATITPTDTPATIQALIQQLAVKDAQIAQKDAQINALITRK